MKVGLVRKVVDNKVVVEFGGEFTAADLATGFPCKAPGEVRDPVLDALYHQLIAACDHPVALATPEQAAVLAEVIGRSARAIASGDDAVELDGEVEGPTEQP